ncbi:hypothetical protein GCK32_022523 [Trichostrongylus colubriformis]|uniref:Uncharacterized protein n=1 Tax=Trichostrongylus colubriformis TaxID=6319 RepID=A0AAN8GDT9_TRICO
MFFLDAFLKGLKPQYDDDACDRLNYYYTPMLFVIFSLTLSAKQADRKAWDDIDVTFLRPTVTSHGESGQETEGLYCCKRSSFRTSF